MRQKPKDERTLTVSHRVLFSVVCIRERVCKCNKDKSSFFSAFYFLLFDLNPPPLPSPHLDGDAPPASNLATLSCNVLISPRKASMVAPMDRSTYLARTSTSRLTLFL